MKIVIDARMINDTGIGRYVRHLVENLEQADDQNTYHILLRAKDWDSYTPASPRFTKVLANYRFYGLAEQLLLPWKLRQLKPDLVHFPHLNVPLSWFASFVVTIHDLTLVDYKNVRGEDWRRWLYEAKYWIMRLVLWRAIKFSRAVLTDSDYVHQQIVDRYHVKPTKVATTLLAVDKLSAESAQPMAINGKDNFLLYVGNFYPHKNIAKLLEAMSILVEQQKGLKLVLVGKVDYFQEQLKTRVGELKLVDKVIFTGFVSDAELAWLYDHATAYVFPSLSEGFGLPGLEAMTQNLPVLAANASCLPEIYGDAAIYFDPTDTKDMADKIKHFLENNELKDRLKAAGPKRIAEYSWARTAEETLAVYNRFAKPEEPESFPNTKSTENRIDNLG